MAGAYLNQCMSLGIDDNVENPEQGRKQGRRQTKDLSAESVYGRRRHPEIDDLSHYGLRNELYLKSEHPEDMSEVTDQDIGSTSMVLAIRSLERTIDHHCALLNRKASSPLGGLKKRFSSTSLNFGASKGPGSLPAHCMPPVPKSAQTKVTSERTDRVMVYIRVVFLKLGEIDTMKENFAADAFIQAKWREPELDNTDNMPDDEIEWENYWNPKLYVENNLGEPKENVWQAVRFDTNGEATVYERRRIKGCFLENLELGEFPFDTQDLTLTITSERSEAEIDLEEDHSEMSSINIQSFVDEQEWKLHSHVETWKRVTTRIYHNSKFKHPAISTSCRASRRPGFYIWNIFLVMLFICSLAFGTFTVEYTLPQNRLQLSFILLLTTITFKFVVSQTLPRISYLTYMDKYILTSMGILCAVCIWHSVAPLLSNKDNFAMTADSWALGLLGGSYAMFHLVFFLYIYFVALKKRWKYNEKDHEHKERMKKLQKLQEKEWSDLNSIKVDTV